MEEGKSLSVVGHLEELRRRIIVCLVSVSAASVLSFFYSEEIMGFIMRPVGELIFISPQEAFISYLKLSVISGVFLSSPVIIYEAWRFISAGLRAEERKVLLIYMPVSFMLFCTGVVFAFNAIIPIGMKFLLSFSGAHLTPMISVGSYISFVSVMLLVFGIVFLLPVFMIFLTRINIIAPGTLRKNRRYVIFSIFVIAAILTPPDVVTQILMALPLILLYEIGVWMSVLLGKRDNA